MGIILNTSRFANAMKEYDRIVKEKLGKKGTYNYVLVKMLRRGYSVQVTRTKPKKSKIIMRMRRLN